jgi:hypothetical protein
MIMLHNIVSHVSLKKKCYIKMMKIKVLNEIYLQILFTIQRLSRQLFC